MANNLLMGRKHASTYKYFSIFSCLSCILRSKRWQTANQKGTENNYLTIAESVSINQCVWPPCDPQPSSSEVEGWRCKLLQIHLSCKLKPAQCKLSSKSSSFASQFKFMSMMEKKLHRAWAWTLCMCGFWTSCAWIVTATFNMFVIFQFVLMISWFLHCSA